MTDCLKSTRLVTMSSRQQRSVKAGSSAEDARAQRMRNTVELRKQKTDDKMKRLRNIDTPGSDTLGGGPDGASSVCFCISAFLRVLCGPLSLLRAKPGATCTRSDSGKENVCGARFRPSRLVGMFISRLLSERTAARALAGALQAAKEEVGGLRDEFLRVAMQGVSTGHGGVVD